MHKPSLTQAEFAGVSQKKFLCGPKQKFGFNCQAACDVRERILDISFKSSNLYKQLDGGLLHPGLVLFGDNAYLNLTTMVTPYPNIAG